MTPASPTRSETEPHVLSSDTSPTTGINELLYCSVRVFSDGSSTSTPMTVAPPAISLATVAAPIPAAAPEMTANWPVYLRALIMSAPRRLRPENGVCAATHQCRCLQPSSLVANSLQQPFLRPHPLPYTAPLIGRMHVRRAWPRSIAPQRRYFVPLPEPAFDMEFPPPHRSGYSAIAYRYPRDDLQLEHRRARFDLQTGVPRARLPSSSVRGLESVEFRGHQSVFPSTRGPRVRSLEPYP